MREEEAVSFRRRDIDGLWCTMNRRKFYLHSLAFWLVLLAALREGGCGR